jgi:RimJ/RimL family protein N-acetyltransferase
MGCGLHGGTEVSIIKMHDVTLYGGAGEYNIILRPLCDEHLPLLYKWNADPEVLYWCEDAVVEAYDADTVHDIYGGTSQNALCFLIEVNGEPAGECWLQKMNLKHISGMYPRAADVRRIDMMIGEKAYWNRGIGSALAGMLVDFAFIGENVDVLHILVFDFNGRSRRVFEKNGFQVCMREPPAKPSVKVKEEIHLRLTRQEYIERRRAIILQSGRSCESHRAS